MRVHLLCAVGAAALLPLCAHTLQADATVESGRQTEQLPDWVVRLVARHPRKQVAADELPSIPSPPSKQVAADELPSVPSAPKTQQLAADELSSIPSAPKTQPAADELLSTPGKQLAADELPSPPLNLKLLAADDELGSLSIIPDWGPEWIDTKDPTKSKNVSAMLLTELTRGAKPMLVPYTVWSFGEMPAKAREGFCKASRNWGASSAYVWHMPAVEHLLERHPGWKLVWPKMPRTVMKSDIARYLVAYEHGGTYTDYDVLGRLPPPAKEGISLVLQVEQTLERWQVSKRSVTGREKHYLQRIAQYFFAVEPKHRFFEMVLQEALNRVSVLLFDENHQDWADKWVLWSTGPDVITTVYHEHFQNDTSVILSQQDAIAKHLSAGAWKRGKDAVK